MKRDILVAGVRIIEIYSQGVGVVGKLVGWLVWRWEISKGRTTGTGS